MGKIIKIAIAILFLGCLAKMLYGYFIFVRLVGMLGFAWLAFREKEKGNEGFFFFFVASAILINPIFKIALGRHIWNVVDVIWAIILLSSTFYKPNDSQKQDK